MHPAKRLDLDRLQHQHGEASSTQMFHDATLIPAGRLDADARDVGPGQIGRKGAPAGQSVGDLPTFGSTVNRDIKLGFGRIDSSLRHVSLCHLLRPRLVKRTKLFRQPSGSDEGADDDHATRQPKTAQGGLDPIASGPPRIAIRGGPFLKEHPDNNRTRYNKGGEKRESACPPSSALKK